jgi:hypothetical protein
MRPELVVVGGRVKLLSQRLANRLPPGWKRGLNPIHVEGRGDYLVKANVSQLYATAREILGPDFKLAGRAVTA